MNGQSVCPCQAFLDSVIFAVKVGAYPNGAPERPNTIAFDQAGKAFQGHTL
jgi:hypothetical protein